MSLARGGVGAGPTCCCLASAPLPVVAPGLLQSGLPGPPLLGAHQPRALGSTLTQCLCELGPQDTIEPSLALLKGTKPLKAHVYLNVLVKLIDRLIVKHLSQLHAALAAAAAGREHYYTSPVISTFGATP